MEYKFNNDKNRMRYKLSLSSMEVAFILHKGHDVEYNHTPQKKDKKVQYYHITDKTGNKRGEDRNEINAKHKYMTDHV